MHLLQSNSISKAQGGQLARHALAALIAGVLLAALAVSAKAWFAKSSSGNGENGSINAYAPSKKIEQAPKAVPFKQSVRVWVHADRISPDLIYARPGKLLLEVENETNLDISLRCERQIVGNSNQLHGIVKTTKRGKRAGLEVELGAGEYIFYDESRPGFKGRLIVDPSIR